MASRVVLARSVRRDLAAVTASVNADPSIKSSD
jgi:hypothetical protein